MPIVMLKGVTCRFPALAEPQAIGEGDPAYGAKFPIDPSGPLVAEIEAAMFEAATQKWKDDGKAVLAMLTENKKVCFERRPYLSKKGEAYSGFENMFTLGARTPINKARPSVFNKYGEPLIADGQFIGGKTRSDVERLIYDGCIVNAKVEIWAQDNSFGRRVNCSLLGVMFAAEGQHFGGGSGPASADDFAAMAAKPDPLADAGAAASVL